MGVTEAPVSQGRATGTVARLVEDAGHTLLRPVNDASLLENRVDGIVIYDPTGQGDWPTRPLILAVGVSEPAGLLDLIAVARRRGPGAVVVRAEAVDDGARRAADDAGVPLLSLGSEASWMQLATTLAPLIAEQRPPASVPRPLSGVPSGDLFALANAIAEILDAPVTVEDRDSRVLAFSIRQEEADPSRVGAILNRQVTPWATQDLRERGVFRELYRTDQPLFVEPPASGHEGFTMPRVVLGIRAGDEILGSVWAAVPKPLSEQRMKGFGDLQGAVAVHLLSHRANANVERRIRSDLMAQALTGGPEVVEVAARLGLPRRPAIVLALSLPDMEQDGPHPPADKAAELLRLGDALDMYLGASQPGASAALIGDVVYGILPIAQGVDEAPTRAQRMAADFLSRVGRRSAAVIGVGSIAADAHDLARARNDADRALRLARTSTAGRRIYSTTEDAFDVLMMEIADLVTARGMTVSGSLARLLEHDALHNASIVATLRAWLDHFGDNIAASHALHVHPNTFRYRLKRAAEVSGLDLDDRDVRLSLMLQLRLFLRE
jgi:PucR C-terminal helix-turn-helix domain/GGDEF-like domain